MIQQATTIETDPVLLPYLTAQNEYEADVHLTRLLNENIEPLVKNIIGYKLRVSFNSSSPQEAEDVFSETIVNLLTHLSELRSNNQQPIKNFRSYTAVTTYRACSEYLRRKYPQRHSLKNKLRYFLNNQTGFAIWEDDSEELIAGFSRFQHDKTKQATHSEIQNYQDKLNDFERNHLLRGSAQGCSLNDLLTAFFNWTEKPVEIDSLVGIVASLWQIKDVQSKNVEEENETALENLADTKSGFANELDQRSYLSRLWNEIKEMSPKHCAALLLNLRDEQNGCVLDLFLFTGIASFKEIAVALGKTEEWLAEIWNGLPLEDALIAKHLELERQQVINLRKTARLRLARKMNEFFG